MTKYIGGGKFNVELWLKSSARAKKFAREHGLNFYYEVRPPKGGVKPPWKWDRPRGLPMYVVSNHPHFGKDIPGKHYSTLARGGCRIKKVKI